MAALEKRVKTALQETRVLILGAQVLFGFHLNSAFQSGFDELSAGARICHALAFFLMTIAMGSLIAPSMQHQIVEGGQATKRILSITSLFAGIALIPFALSLGLDLFIVLSHRFGIITAVSGGVLFCALALALWFGSKWPLGRAPKEVLMEGKPTSLDVRIEQMLTEARVILPGAQALFGFQLSILLTQGFANLPFSSKLVHAMALGCIALAVMLLMTPASIHRVAYGGENTETFFRIGSRFVITAALPLAIGIACDLYVAVAKGVESPVIGLMTALAAAVLLAGLWLAYPLFLRSKLSAPGKGAQGAEWNRKAAARLSR